MIMLTLTTLKRIFLSHEEKKKRKESIQEFGTDFILAITSLSNSSNKRDSCLFIIF